MSPTGSVLLAALVWSMGAFAAEPAPASPAAEPAPAAPTSEPTAETPGPEAPGPEAPDPEDEESLPEALPLEPVVRGGVAEDVPVVPRLALGALLGAAVPFAHLGPSVAPGLEGGYVLDPKGRYTVLLGLSYSGGSADGVGEDPAFPDGYTWRLSLRAMQVAPAFRWRILPWEEPMSPEISAGPLLTIGDAVTTGAAGGQAFPETREARVVPGGFLAAGIAGRVGPGMLEGRMTLSMVHLDGELTGGALVPALTPAIGYRVSR